MGIDLENVRAVVDHPDTDDLVARSLAWSIGRYHDVTSSYRSGMAEISRCVAQRTAPGPELVALLTLHADLHLRLGEVNEAAGIVDRAATLSEEVGVPAWDDTCVVRTSGEIALRRDDPETAVRLAEEALASASVSPRGEARIWNLLAIARWTLGDRQAAAEALEQCLRAEEVAGLDSFLATTHGNYAELLLALGDPAGAARHQLAALELARSMGQATLVAYSHMVAARFALDDDAAADVRRNSKRPPTRSSPPRVCPCMPATRSSGSPCSRPHAGSWATPPSPGPVPTVHRARPRPLQTRPNRSCAVAP